MKIIGVVRKSGVYEGNPYDNVNFDCTEPYAEGKGIGLKAKTFKVKHMVLVEQFEKEMTEQELAAFVGQEAEFYFDEFHNVKFISIRKSQSR